MGEKYGYEVSKVPISELETRAKRNKLPRVRTDKEIIELTRQMLADEGLKNIDIVLKVSRYQGDDKNAKYADATVWESESGGSFKLNVHPFHRYTPIGWLRASVKHEIKHIFEHIRRWGKDTKEVNKGVATMKKTLERIPWGEEKASQKGFAKEFKDEECPECSAGWGKLHKRGCDVEECPICGGQLMTCGHVPIVWRGYKAGPAETERIQIRRKKVKPKKKTRNYTPASLKVVRQ